MKILLTDAFSRETPIFPHSHLQLSSMRLATEKETWCTSVYPCGTSRPPEGNQLLHNWIGYNLACLYPASLDMKPSFNYPAYLICLLRDTKAEGWQGVVSTKGVSFLGSGVIRSGLSGLQHVRRGNCADAAAAATVVWSST